MKADDKSPLYLSLPHRDTQNPVRLKSNLRMATMKEKALITGWSQSLNRKTKTDKIWFLTFISLPFVWDFSLLRGINRSLSKGENRKEKHKDTVLQETGLLEDVYRVTWHQGTYTVLRAWAQNMCLETEPGLNRGFSLALHACAHPRQPELNSTTKVRGVAWNDLESAYSQSLHSWRCWSH